MRERGAHSPRREASSARPSAGGARPSRRARDARRAPRVRRVGRVGRGGSRSSVTAGDTTGAHGGSNDLRTMLRARRSRRDPRAPAGGRSLTGVFDVAPPAPSWLTGVESRAREQPRSRAGLAGYPSVPVPAGEARPTRSSSSTTGSWSPPRRGTRGVPVPTAGGGVEARHGRGGRPVRGTASLEAAPCRTSSRGSARISASRLLERGERPRRTRGTDAPRKPRPRVSLFARRTSPRRVDSPVHQGAARRGARTRRALIRRSAARRDARSRRGSTASPTRERSKRSRANAARSDASRSPRSGARCATICRTRRLALFGAWRSLPIRGDALAPVAHRGAVFVAPDEAEATMDPDRMNERGDAEAAPAHAGEASRATTTTIRFSTRRATHRARRRRVPSGTRERATRRASGTPRLNPRARGGGV